MANLYEIFRAEEEGLTKNAAIDTLFGYPNLKTKTERYRILIKHPDENLWAGIIDDDLINACSKMTTEQQVVYYDNSDLKDHQYLQDNDWFSEEEI